MEATLVDDIALCIVVAWVVAVATQLLRQPLLIAYLGAGVAIGPVGLEWIQNRESIKTISELGLIFLLFMIGLEIDLKKMVRAGRSITVTAVTQVGGGLVLGLGFFWLCGFGLGGHKSGARVGIQQTESFHGGYFFFFEVGVNTEAVTGPAVGGALRAAAVFVIFVCRIVSRLFTVM